MRVSLIVVRIGILRRRYADAASVLVHIEGELSGHLAADDTASACLVPYTWSSKFRLRTAMRIELPGSR